MDFPKSLARERISERSGFKAPYTLILWLVILGALLILAKGTTFLNPSSVVVFNPRLVPNSSVTYQDNSIIRTSVGLSDFPSTMGSSNENERVVRTRSLNADQTYYEFSIGNQLVEVAKFSRDFTQLKYITGADYAFVSSGLYIKRANSEFPEKVYNQKTEESIFSYYYESEEQSFYLLVGSDTQMKLLRVGVYGEQELYTLNEVLTAGQIAHIENGNVYLNNTLNTCLEINTLTKIETSIDCKFMKQNEAGINFYIAGNAVKKYDQTSETTVFQEVNVLPEKIIGYIDSYALVYKTTLEGSDDSTENLKSLYISSLSRSILLPENFAVSDYYLVGDIIYITDGFSLQAIDSSVPTSSSVPEWVEVIGRSSVASVEFVY